MTVSKMFILSILLNIWVCEGYKILLVFPLPSTSHGILGDNMVKHLLEAGHEVTYITPFTKRPAHPNLHIVDASENTKLFNENTINVKQIMDKEVNFQNSDFLSTIMVGVASHTMGLSNIQKFIQDPKQQFDVVIAEWMFSDLYSVFSTVFNCPLIWFTTIEPHWIILDLVDGLINPAYTNDYLSEHVHPLSFTQRGFELWKQVSGLLSRNFKFYYKEEEVYQRNVVPVLKQKGKPVPSYQEIRFNASLVLGNNHVVLGDAFALPKAYKEIGGYHIDKVVKPLPENLKNIFDNAEHGVIYFSMGSNVKSKDLPIGLKQGLLKVLGGLKQTVIWKFEEQLPDVPKNVHIVHWAPQQSILAHPKTTLFISHGGLLSMTETAHFGVPVIAIPVFADQFANALRVQRKGYGKKLDLTYTMHEELKTALDEVLGNSQYTKRAKEISLVYHDSPMTPTETFLFWVNHVVRTNGAPHLRSPALELPLYQRLYLDLIAVLLVSIFIIKCILCYICQVFCGKAKGKKEKRH